MTFDAEAHLRAVITHPYRSDVCFICAKELNASNRADEHIIPAWMQRQFNLWNQELVLLNRTSIQYRRLVIPCCIQCNTDRFAPLEGRIRTAVQNGINVARRLSHFDIYKWLAKILLGLMYKELSLPFDRRNPGLGTILTDDFIRRYQILHHWLQLSAACGYCPDYCPGSVWVFQVQTPDDLECQFDLKDEIKYGVIAIRAGSIGFIADFLENGVHAKLFQSRTKCLSKISLHPRQFDELVAKTVYEAKLLGQESQANLFTLDGTNLYTAIQWHSTVDGFPLDDWNLEEYVSILAHYTNLPLENVYRPPDGFCSWLRGPNGEFVFWPLGKPFPYSGEFWIPSYSKTHE
ncbi:hypothetical protein AB1L30_11645 [Bremerella sp. JC817]|uniref:hypothetical protein n=1 Tax=Bremerella sp. JC817 TaxID=3231756 RepID=UPI0034586120